MRCPNDVRPRIPRSSRMMEVQERMTERALELLALPEDTPHLLLDLGCGSGLSGETITEAGQMWVGCDISPAMLGTEGCRSWILAILARVF